MIAIGVGAALALLVLDQLLLEPMFVRLSSADKRIDDDSLTLAQASGITHNGAMASVRWQKMSAGHIGNDASATQSKLLNHVGLAARNASVNLASIRPERGEKAMGFARTGLRASGNVTMATLVAFLQHMQSSDLPVRVTDIQIKANKEGTDDLTVDVGISTLYKLSAAEEAK